MRSQTLYPTELPAQVQDIYYHRPRGLSTVFAKKFKIFFAKQKRFFCPLRAAAGGLFFGRRQTACSRRPAPGGAPVRPAGALCALGCVPCAPWDALRALRCPRAPCGVPARPGMCPCAACGAPMRSGVPLCALGCPYALWGAPCPLWGCPVCSSVFSVRPCVALRASRSLAAHHAPQYRARLSPAQRRSSPPPRRTAEKKPGRSKRSGRALFISLSGDEAQVSDQALGLPNWQSLLPESEVHISSMFRGSL